MSDKAKALPCPHCALSEAEQKCWIVWNNVDKGEGVVFDNQDDAKTAATGERRYQTSTLAEFFHEAYGEEGDLPIEEIGLAAVNAYDPKRDATFEAGMHDLRAAKIEARRKSDAALEAAERALNEILWAHRTNHGCMSTIIDDMRSIAKDAITLIKEARNG